MHYKCLRFNMLHILNSTKENITSKYITRSLMKMCTYYTNYDGLGNVEFLIRHIYIIFDNINTS